MSRKAQISSEYIVISAVVVLIALLVLSVSGSATPIGGDVSSTQSRNYWASSSPFSIAEWKYNDEKLQLIVQNMEGEKLTLTGITIGGASVLSGKREFAVGEYKTITIDMDTACGNEGEQFELPEVRLAYSKSGMAGLIQEGGKPIVGWCS